MSTVEKVFIRIPIQRSFESDGHRYIYGYAAIFDSPDAYGTVISKQVVEKSLPRLKQYPSLRYMHKDPLGKIIFDMTVNGVSTFIDEHGFHILGEINQACEKEWQMIKQGSFGFSYGMLPAQNGIQRKKFNGNVYDVFVDGELYEISVVDAPAHVDAKVNVITRSLTYYANSSEPSRSFEQLHEDQINALFQGTCAIQGLTVKSSSKNQTEQGE